ncbi:hypothetical protein [Aquabacter spiritensis]|uniref:Uncharacterized protein n=1 Tax=Aquabacter spiritensis TaxID=933073 RepID=A0A4V2UXS4_9HYPH|nr:hypothetical protein [Aquabacter spiritensis]TCT04658.1 hypothetical protein EDC64_10690 [Aquabacter spiritensis]
MAKDQRKWPLWAAGAALAVLLVGCGTPSSNWGTGVVTEADPWGAYEAVVPIPAPDAPPRVFQCTGPWAPTTTEVNLIADFGQQAISRADVMQPDGSMAPGSVLLAGEPKLRVDIAWADALGYTIPTRVAFTDETRWGVAGITIGTSLADVEKANGGPFRLVGFGGTNGGVVADWRGGRLANMTGPCRLGVQFAISALASDSAQAKVSGPKVYNSSDPAIRAINPTVGQFWVRYKW